MLMQCDGRKIYLMPAWPKEWDVSFKLHAPYGTIMEGRFEAGAMLNLRVIPQERTQDVTVM